jgi:pimeloyl-ACP methyl ester carboxylesterase
MHTISPPNLLTSGIIRWTLILGAVITAAASPQVFADDAKPTIVLVHGAFADGSGWSKVILRLEKAGYTAIAVQNQMSTLSEDIATTKRVIDAVKGPVVLVGHSYGGAVITGAGVGSPNVKSLVYIAAFAPDAGEKVAELAGKFGPSSLNTALVPDSAGFLYIDRAKFQQVFAADVSDDEAMVMAAAQRPLAGVAFGGSVETPAWKTLPSWYLVSTEDHAILPELERFMAKRIGAKSIVEVQASHAVFVSHPDEVVALIEAAAN